MNTESMTVEAYFARLEEYLKSGGSDIADESKWEEWQAALADVWLFIPEHIRIVDGVRSPMLDSRAKALYARYRKP